MSEPRHIRFEQTMQDTPPIKPRWRVLNRHHGDPLGIVVWYPAWYQFCFEPYDDTGLIFSADCLRDISDFCEAETRKVGGAK